MFRFHRSFIVASMIPCLVFSLWNEGLPEPYNQIDPLPFTGEGWFLNSVQLEAIIKKYQIKTAIEVGCWVGLSTRFIASTLPSDGKLYAVDHWLGSVENQQGQWAYTPSLPILYEQFLSNVIHAGLAHKIVPIRMESLKAAIYLSSLITPDLIYLDASHDTESVYMDLVAWYPLVKGHGIISGDDWIWDSVQRAVKEFAKKQGLAINASGNFWYLLEQ